MASELERQLASLNQGDHLCPIFESVAERLAVIVPFIKDGLARRERCVHVADDPTAAEVIEALSAAGIDVACQRERGALRFLTKAESYLLSLEFDPAVMFGFLRQEETHALAEGYSGLRVAGEMTWALGPETRCDRLIAFEAGLNKFLENSRSLMLCQYDRTRFDPAVIHDVLRTHPLVVLGDQVYPNPYYEPPDLVPSAEHPASAEFEAKRVDWWIAQLRRTREGLQRHTDQLQGLADASLAINSARSPAEVAQAVTEAAREIIGAHLAGTGFSIDENWAQSVQAVSLSEKYAAWRNYDRPPDGSGIYSLICRTNRPLRLTQAELEAHPNWRGFGKEAGSHPPLRGFLAAPLVAGDGRNIGLIALSDKYEGEFTADDEAMLIQLAQTASIAIENAWLYEQVKAGHQHLQALSRQLLEVQEAERRSLARELHDELGQLLTGLRLLLKAKDDRPTDSLDARLEQARGIVDELLGRIRRLSFDLRPAALDQLGLLAALLALFERYTDQTGVRVHFEHEGAEGRFEPDVETTVYRIVQEALTNVARHAGVDTATVRVWSVAGSMGIQIEDTGRGFDPEAVVAAPRSSGLAGMQERVILLGGHLAIESRPGEGARLTAELPQRDRSGR
jgi:signal transduction histidine kinase